MQMNTFGEGEDALRNTDLDTLRELAYRVAQSHVAVCGLTSREGDCSHIPEQDTRNRIDKLDRSQLVAVLAPFAWTALDHHTRPRR